MARSSNSSRSKNSGSSRKKVSLLDALVRAANRIDYAPVPTSSTQWRRLIGWGLVIGSVLAGIACVSYFLNGPADQSLVEAGVAEAAPAANDGGRLGAWVSDLLVRGSFGIMSIPVLMYTFFLGLVLIEGEYYGLALRLLRYVGFLVIFVSVFLSYIVYIGGGNPDYGGGFGYFITAWLIHLIGSFGTGLVLLFALIAYLTLTFNAEIRATSLIDRLNLFKDSAQKVVASRKGLATADNGSPRNKKVKPADEAQEAGNALRDAGGASRVHAIAEVVRKQKEAREGAQSPANTTASRSLSPTSEDGADEDLPFDPDPPAMQEPRLSARAVRPVVTPPVDDDEKPRELSLKDITQLRLRQSESPRQDGQLEFVVEKNDNADDVAADLKEYIPLGDDNVGLVVGSNSVEKIIEEDSQELDPETAAEFEDWTEFDPTLELSEYAYPSWGMLDTHGNTGEAREVDMKELEENKNRIIKTLQDYKIEIVKITATIGPTVTLYEIVPAPGVRISKIRSLEDDIALSLSALGIRIIAPIPGKGTIGIEVPNSKPEVVSLRSVLLTKKFTESKFELPIALGKTIDNKVFIADLNKMPHLLIAGATGQGKSVGINTIISSVLFKRHPGEVKFVLIDPKKVELSLYQALHHHFLAQMPEQMEPIITDTQDAIKVLKCLCVEMDQRYDLLKKARVRNVQEYNDKFKKRQLNPRKGHFFMPYIVLVIDELADLMMTAGKEVELPIARLAQLARAVGIHLVVATQRPSVNVITGIIKANFPARLSYRVISKVDSRTILDANGADQLIGRGDMLLMMGSDLIRLQNAFIDTPEVERVVEFIASQRGYTEPYYLPELPSDGNDDDDMDEDTPFERDPMFDEAAKLVVRYQLGSASLIQRKMKLGYNRAGRIIDQLERAGIVGPHSGSKAREVLFQDETSLERFLGNLG